MHRITDSPDQPTTGLPRVVIVGAGFGGLEVARGLGGAPVRVTVIDRTNHHVFQPLLYQVATAGLSPADIAAPVRSVLRGQRNTEVLMAEVTGVDLARRCVFAEGREEQYDYLVIATGSQHAYFGRDEWAPFAPGLKTLADATAIRRTILQAFESAEMEADPAKRAALMTFVLVGAGPTGVEMAGAIAELAHAALAKDFRHIDPRSARILLVEAGPRVLAAFPPGLSDAASRALTRLGVEIRTGSPVESIDASGVAIGGERVPARTVIWTAGVQASPAAAWLGAEHDAAGRVKVLPDLSLAGHPEVFVIGDTALVVQDGQQLPGVAPVAMQEGKLLARAIRARAAGLPAPGPFRYHDKGSLATVGRAYAVAFRGTTKVSGFVAWALWLGVHIWYLIGFRNRLLVMIQWAWAYLTFQRGVRLIVPQGSPADDGR